ncbi:MAG: transcriptional regulator [Bryobacterales bacterium]|nr:transcriptional regulator [Bryobacterales bacterium]
MNRNPVAASLSQRAYNDIRYRILSGQLPLGTSISRRTLAADLGMSVVPVSDALQRLSTEGLVESWPRVGTRVRIPTSQDVRGHYVVREALESQSARLFSQKSTPEERKEILELAETLDQLYRNGNADDESKEALFALHQLHQQFHMRIAECGGHPALCQAIENNHVLTFNWLYDTAARRTKLPERHHGRLAESLCQDDPEKADLAMREHVIYGRDDLLRTLSVLFR